MRLKQLDLWILTGAIVLSVLAVSLHVREVVRTGVAQPPVYAASGRGGDAYPTVGGFVVEVDSTGTALRAGDRLLSVGSHDLAGRGYLGFLGLALQEAGSDLRVPVVYERGGRRLETEMRLRPFAVSWLRVPFLVSMLPLMILTLLRRPGDSYARLSVVAFTGLTVGEAIF